MASRRMGSPASTDSFAHQLDAFMVQVGCTNAELAAASGLSPSAVGRYRSGQRVSGAASLQAKALASGVAALAEQRGYPAPVVERVCDAIAGGRPAKQLTLSTERLATLLEVVGVSNAELARGLNYDPSYISRVCSGDRVPSDLDFFVHQIVRFAYARQASRKAVPALAALACVESEASEDKLVDALCAWLGEDEDPGLRAIASFLDKIDAFDAAAYVQALGYEATAPAVQDVPVGERAYRGVEGQCRAELDFLTRIVGERPGEPVIMFGDFPMEDMASVSGFAGQWLAGLARMLRAGHRVLNIHTVNRPLAEMLLGLEAWLPLYMTGLVSAFYVAGQFTGPFCHLIRSSHETSLEGWGVAGDHEGAGFVLTDDPAAVAAGRRRACALMQKARPLVKTYVQGDAPALDAFWEDHASSTAPKGALLSAPPLYAADDALVARICAACGLNDAQAMRVRALRARQLDLVERSLQVSSWEVEVARLSAQEFGRSAAHVSLGGAFIDGAKAYTWDLYREHLAAVERFAVEHPTWRLTWGGDRGLRNVQVVYAARSCALVAKNSGPAIHFTFQHPKMVAAIEGLHARRTVAPAVEGPGCPV